jgi:arylsulfatase
MRPNIVYILTDNLGYGELGSYGGGAIRGAPTPRADRLAEDGLRLTNFNVEAQCTPSRSATLTGRYAYRSGTLTVPIGNPTVCDFASQGLNPWEVTIARVLSDLGYNTAHYGKWHLGSVDGRYPNDQGFDEWWGIPRTTDEAFWPGNPGFEASGVEPQYILEGRKGEPSRRVAVYNLERRRLLDTEITKKAIEFMKRSVAEGKPFYAYLPLTQVHLPTLPHPDFAGRTGNGDFADSVVETDHHLGEILDAVDALGIRDNTIVVFTSDNGPEATYPWQGSSGPWRGYYFTHMEGSLRVPFLIRWPNQIPRGLVSDGIVHQVDTFTTIARVVGAPLPADRAIDGLDQTDFFAGRTPHSARESVLAFVGERLEAVKWRNWKLAFYEETRDWFGTPRKLTLPKLFNLLTDPKEEYPEETLRNTWAVDRCLKAVREFYDSLKRYPVVPEGLRERFQPPQPPNNA